MVTTNKERTMHKKYPLGCAVWELTLKCNLRCVHCGATAACARKDELTTDEALQVVSDLDKIGCGGVALMGGEPFLRKDWETIAEAVKATGMHLSFITNGYLLKGKRLERLAEFEPNVVGVSLDGARPEVHDKIRQVKGSFKRALAGAYASREAGMPTSIITTLTKWNIGELEGIKDLILNRDIGWQIQVASPHGGRFSKGLVLTPDEFYFIGLQIASFRERYPREVLPVIGAHDLGYHSCFMPSLMTHPVWSGCQAGITTLGIQSNGNLKACLSLSDDFIECNLRDRSIPEVWNDPKAFKLNRHFKPSYLEGFCKTCKYGKTCQGGCSNMAFDTTGSAYDNPYCFYSIEYNKLNGGCANGKR